MGRILKKNFFVSILILILFISGCAGPKKMPNDSTPQEYFTNLRGCFLLYNMKTKAFEKIIGEEVCREQLPACSTFKVPLAVMAFDSGIIKDKNATLKWDGVKNDLMAHNQDHSAVTWMKDSVVWVSQRITPALGTKKLQKYLNDFDYGNKDISQGLRTAWLARPGDNSTALKISAYQQVEFMEKLWTDRLPASKQALQVTRELTYLEDSPKGYRLNGKTGSNSFEHNRSLKFGWFVAHLERSSQQYIAVTNIADLQPQSNPGYGGPRAKDLTKRILADLGLW